MTSAPLTTSPSLPPWAARGLQIAAVALLLFLTLKGCALYTRQNSYNAGAAALEQGDWAAARARLWPIFRDDPAYREAGTLLKESYYRPALAAIAARDWPAAAEAVVGLEALDSRYSNLQEQVAAAGPELDAPLRAARTRAWAGGAPRLERSLAPGADRLALSPDGRTLVASEGSDLLIWGPGADEPLRLAGQLDFVSDIELSPDGAQIATASVLSGVQLRGLDGAPAGEVFGEGATQVAFSHDGALLAAGDLKGHVGLYRLEDRSLVRSFEIDATSGVFSELAFSPDDATLLATAASRSLDTEVDKVFAWAVGSGELRWSSYQLFGGLALAVSPGGEHVAVGNGFGEVTVYRIRDGEQVWRRQDHKETVTKRQGRSYEQVPVNGVLALRYSADGGLLASGGVQGLVIYDADGEQVSAVGRDEGAGLPVALAFAPDGQPLVALAYEQGVQIWRAAPGVGREAGSQ